MLPSDCNLIATQYPSPLGLLLSMIYLKKGLQHYSEIETKILAIIISPPYIHQLSMKIKGFIVWSRWKWTWGTVPDMLLKIQGVQLQPQSPKRVSWGQELPSPPQHMHTQRSYLHNWIDEYQDNLWKAQGSIQCYWGTSKYQAQAQGRERTALIGIQDTWRLCNRMPGHSQYWS